MMAQPIDDFVVDSTGRSIILLQRREAMDGSQRYTLHRYDIQTQQLETLLDGVPYLYDLSISPDGVWLLKWHNSTTGASPLPS